MLATKEALQFETELIARKARTKLGRDGHLAPVAIFLRDSLTEVAMMPMEIGDDEVNARARRILADAVQRSTPEAVVVVYQTMAVISDNDEEAEAIAELEEHPKKKIILNITAVSPVAEHGMKIVYGVKDKKLRFEDEYTIDEAGHCKFTKGLWGVVN